MNFENSENLLKSAFNGSLVLFTGAGAVAGSFVGKEKKLAYLGLQLAEELAKLFFPEDPYKKESLQLICTEIENVMGKEKLVQALTNLLVPVEPSNALKLIPKIQWNAIYSVNVDSSIEEAYFNVVDKVQNQITVVKPEDRLAEDKLCEVSYFKLHGCLSVDPSNVIFSHKGYTEVRERYLKLFSNLKANLCDNPFLFIGFGFEDGDFQDVWQNIKKYTGIEKRFKSTYLVWPDPPDRFVKSMRTEGVTVINSTTQEFLPWLYANLPGRPISLSDKIADKVNPIRVLCEREFSADIPQELLYKFKNFAEIVSQIPSPSKLPDQSRFYLGENPDWDDIKLGLPIKRNLADDILIDFEQWFSSGSLKSTLVLGAAGYGKTTLLMMLANYIANSYSTICIWVKNQVEIDPVTLAEIISIINKPAVIFIDDGYRCISSIRKLIQDCRDNKLKAFLLVTSRPSDWNSAKQTSSLEKISSIYLEKLDEFEADNLAEVMNKSGKLSREFQEKSIIELRNHYLVEGERHLIAGLMTSVFGNGQKFEEIIANEFFKISSDVAKDAYLYTSVVHSLGLKLPLLLFLRCLNIEISEYQKIYPLVEETIIEEQDLSGDLILRTQHRVIAESLIANVLSSSDANNILLNLGKSVNQHSRTEYNILIKLYDENYLENILKESGYIRSFYFNLNEEFPCDVFILQHWAIYESKNDNSKKAKELIDDALSKIDSKSKFYFHLVNTKGIIWLRDAINEEDSVKADYLLRKGSEFIRELIKIDHDKEIHYISLIDKLFTFARRQLKGNEDRIKIYEVIETDLEDALKRYPNSSDLLALSAKLEVELTHLPDAEALLNKSLLINGGNIRSRILLIRLLISGLQYDKALEFTQSGLILDHKSSMLLKTRIVCYRKLDKPWDEIRSAIKNYLKIVPMDIEERLLLIKGLLNNGELKEANDHIAIMKKLDVPYRDKILRSYLIDNNVVQGTYHANRLGRGFLEIDGFPKGLDAFINISILNYKGKIYDGIRLRCEVILNGLGLYVKKIITS